MPVYQAPLKDMNFLLKDVFAVDQLWQQYDGTKELDFDTAQAILQEGAKYCQEVIFPLLQSADEEGCKRDDSAKVTTPKGFKEAYQLFREGGWQSLGGDPEYGGHGLPKSLTVLVEEMLFGANTSFALFPVLSNGAALSLLSHGQEELKSKVLPNLYSGEWMGTMCLTEPHAGTDLGIIKTKAIPESDGCFSITGTKIFITGGEHDLSDNIIHFVLAKTPDAPAGSKGISLFVVPKLHINDDGSLGDVNHVECGSIEHKMGIKASPTCVMNFDGAKGYLLGKENHGLSYMFTMMNYERLTIGIQGLGASEIAYQNAVEYAKERLQGRSPNGVANKNQMADPLIVHPEIRRLLLNIKANTEAGRALGLYTAKCLDTAKFSNDANEVKKANAMVALLTPVVKAFLSDNGFDACVDGQMVFGGHGYIKEHGMEQLLRDVRIAQIYEGTNGVQSLDLMGRKVVANGGKYLDLLIDEMECFIETQKGHEQFSAYFKDLSNYVSLTKEAASVVIEKSKTNPAEIGAASVDFLKLLGTTLFCYFWLKMMLVASEKTGDEFYEDKVTTGEFYFNRIAPRALSLHRAVLNGADSLMKLKAENF